MYIIRVCCPGKIMYLRGYKMPGKLFTSWTFHFYTFFFITISYFFRVLQIAASSNNVIFIYTDLYIKIPPYTVKLPANIRIGMPTFKVIFCQLGIPLGHG